MTSAGCLLVQALDLLLAKMEGAGLDFSRVAALSGSGQVGVCVFVWLFEQGHVTQTDCCDWPSTPAATRQRLLETRSRRGPEEAGDVPPLPTAPPAAGQSVEREFYVHNTGFNKTQIFMQFSLVLTQRQSFH